MNTKRLFVAFSMLAACCSARATTWRVNWTNGNDVAAAADATSATRFQTIQAAVAKASADDTILVDPGTYAGPATTNDYGVSRLFIDKELTIESTGTRDDTFIEGAWDPTAAASAHGMGPAAIRCVCATANVTMKGFTFRNGATTDPAGSDAYPHSGGGFYCNAGSGSNGGSASTGKIMDCAFVNCSSGRGGGMRFGTAYRTLFKNCYASKYGAAVRQSYLLFCVIEGCSGVNICAYMGTVVNCTFVNNTTDNFCIQADSAATVVNCVFVSGKSNVMKNTSVMNGSVTYDATFGTAPTAANSQTGVWGAGVFSPLFGDLHPYAGGPLDGTADATISISASSLAPAYRTLDFEGKPVDWTPGKLCPGAFQTVKTPASGKLVFVNNSARLAVDGISVGAGGSSSNYTYETCWPTQHLVQVTASSSAFAVLRLDMSVNGISQLSARPPLMLDDTVWITAPPTGNVCEWKPTQVSSILWVDDDNYGKEGLDGKTEEKAFGTIQDAIDTIDSMTVVKVKKGVYDQGRGQIGCFDSANRVELSKDGYIRLIGVEGAENTVIVGATDTSTLADPQKLGCGPAAMRCLALNMNCVVQGFTLTGGHSGVDATDTADTAITRGGAVCAANGNAFVADCIISNNVAKRAAGGYKGTYVRCRFANNLTIRANGVLRGGVAADCVFEENSAQGGSVQDTTAYNCTMAETNTSYGSAYGESAKVYNSVCYAVVGCYRPPSAVDGTVAYGFNPPSPAPIIADPGFRDLAGGDYRLATVSPAVGLGDPTVGDWWKFAGADINGNRYAFLDGKVISGAIQSLCPAVKVGVTAGPESGVSQAGTVFFDEGESVTVTATDAETRLFNGFALNGEIVAGSSASATFTYQPLGAPVPGDRLEAVYLTNWYVNASMPNDAQSGESPERAKRTIAAALAHAVSGDVVHVAEGEYSEGTMIQSQYVRQVAGSSAPAPYIRARAVVNPGVQLVADGTRENTVILGKSDPGTVDDPEKRGCGPNAERCVVMLGNSLVKGFTVRGGRTDFENIEDDNNHGAGFLCKRDEPSVVEDCQIEGCYSRRAAGARAGVFKRCRFIGNSAALNGTAARHGTHLGCYFDGNTGPDVLTYPKRISCCTFGPGNVTADGHAAPAILSYDADFPIAYGSLFCSDGIVRGPAFVNCAFPNTATFESGSVFTSCVRASAEALARIDAFGAPVAGENPACDGGDLAQWTAAGMEAAFDAAGNPRIQNAAMDIGCYEADWRGRYAADIGRRGCLSVASADFAAHEERSGEVFLPRGEIAGILHSTRTGRFTFPVRITGSGTLAVTVNGATTKYQGPRDAFTLAYDIAAGDFSFSFAYVAAENDAGGAYFGKGGRVCGATFSIR